MQNSGMDVGLTQNKERTMTVESQIEMAVKDLEKATRSLIALTRHYAADKNKQEDLCMYLVNNLHCVDDLNVFLIDFFEGR
jgi:hypothetical protein